MMKNKENSNEGRIRHTMIDLLHEDKTISFDGLSQLTGLTIDTIKQYEEIIVTVLTKLKKLDNFKP
jgi:hypothetical protein